MKMRSLSGLVGLIVLGCSEDSALSGSLEDVYRLDHESVRSRLYASELSIEYVNHRGAVPVRITIARGRLNVVPPETFPLPESGDITGRQVDGSEIPELIRGTVHIERFEPDEGSRVAGDFAAEFEGGRDVLGLQGTFDTTLEVVEWPP